IKSQLANEVCTKFELLDLATRRQRVYIDEPKVLGKLMTAEVGSTIVADLILGHAFFFFYLKERGSFLSHIWIGDTDQCRLTDLRVTHQEVLDFCRVDVLASANEHVLDAPDDAHIALVVDGCKISAVVPAVDIDRL